MVEITAWMDQFVQTLSNAFGERVWFVGLQGSYGRGEATEASDIDTVVILDTLSPADIETYKAMLDTLSPRELLCGFLSGKEELLNWEPADLFQFYYDTTPIMGSLDELLTHIDAEAVTESILLGVCNIFHGCVHNMLYEKDPEMLKELYKCASFVVQAICYQQTGKYFRRQQDLRPVVSPEEQVIVDTFLNLKNGMPVDFQVQSEMLFAWAQNWITKLK
jgi:predicted nucleotidyltransferase